MIAPVIPPQSSLQELVHGPLVTNRLVRPADDDLAYGICSVGDGGRILDKIIFAALDWRPGIRLDLSCLDAGILLAHPVPEGRITMTEGGYFRVPYRLRRRVSLLIGQRALLIGHRSRRVLLIHPPAALDELCAPSLRLLKAGA
ncbi:hypothetical protein IU468_27450 [Nocardia farcinica]|uniref:hypothetical protein n=1 Tax=Nocardia farcinica TaxID=37329 RepID=UPI001894E59E|nr:hypothetical protein [Nocardia farcinica]MBF6260012.1 hypothetical protein [Nocardia farcinica]